MKLTSNHFVALVASVIGLGISPSADALVVTKNFLFRCNYQNQSTVCYSAFTTADSPEACELFSLATRGLALFGGGLVFSPVPGGWDYEQSPSPCTNPAFLGTGYNGHVEPCAPGGPDGWKHLTRHELVWRPPVPPNLQFEYVDIERHLPLPTSTCEGGGGLD